MNFEEISLPNKESGAQKELEKSPKNYEKIAETFSVIVENVADMPIPEKTLEDWKSLCASMQIVDHRIDSTQDGAERNRLIQDIKTDLAGEGRDFSHDESFAEAMDGVRALRDSLENDQKAAFVRSLSMLLDVLQKMKNEKDPHEVLKLTLLEGQMSARPFLPLLPKEFRDSPDYQQLTRALTRLGRVANTFDTFVDLPTDHKNEQVQIRPTPINRLMFLGAAISQTPGFLKRSGMSPELVEKLFTVTKKTVQNRTAD